MNGSAESALSDADAPASFERRLAAARMPPGASVGRGPEAGCRHSATGKELGKVEIPAPTNTAPMTFMHDGHQVIVMAVASATVPAELVAVALPAARPRRPGQD